MKLSKFSIKKYREIIYKYTLVNLNLRSEKSTSSNIIATIPKGTKVEVEFEDEEWIKVKYNSLEGYAYKYYLSTSKYPWTNLNLREEKSTDSKSLTIIPQKARIEVLQVDGDWSKVAYNDMIGYVFNYYLSDDGNSPNDLDYTYFYTDMIRFINENNIESPTNNLIVTDLKNKYTYIFKKDNGVWTLIYKWQSTVGKPATPTIKGRFYINGRKPSFGTDEYLVKYATRIKDGYYYHSILYDATGKYIKDARLGEELSHGCIRLEINNAKWIYENILDTTTVIIH